MPSQNLFERSHQFLLGKIHKPQVSKSSGFYEKARRPSFNLRNDAESPCRILKHFMTEKFCLLIKLLSHKTHLTRVFLKPSKIFFHFCPQPSFWPFLDHKFSDPHHKRNILGYLLDDEPPDVDFFHHIISFSQSPYSHPP